jgi:hypothetical protein
MQDPVSPPRWLELVIFGALAGLLYYPIHVPYQNPDQDYPAGIAMLELLRGGWEAWSLMYPPALTNLMHAGYDVLLIGARLAGRPLDAIELGAAFMRDPLPFRVATRLVAMTSGLVSLVAVTKLTALVADRWSGLVAAVLLGTSYMFVREHHHGMFDAPAATAVIVSLYYSARYVLRPSAGTLAGATIGAALALSCKWNAAVVGCAPILAFLLAPAPASRWRALIVALVAAVLTLLVACPVALFEPARVVTHLGYTFEFFAKLRNVVNRQGGPVYRFGDVLQNGLGICLVTTAAAGMLAVVTRRVRPLLPLATFSVIYACIVWRSPIIINRYALPLAAPTAVLAAYGLNRTQPLSLRLAGVGLLLALGLPSCLAYDRLLAREDSRVVAARWLRANVRPDARIFLPGNIMSVSYVGPDLPRPTFNPDVLPAERGAALKARMDPPFPRTRRYFMLPKRYVEGLPGPGRLAPWSNSVVVTSELREGPFAKESTPPELVSDLERHAVLLADYPVIAAEGPRVYEPEMNFAPMRGVRTLARPGPRLRIWYVRGITPGAEPSPLLEGAANPEAAASQSTGGGGFE